MRLQVFLSRSGICSRRKALELVQAGEVEVNGKKILEPSFEVNPTQDSVSFQGKPIKPKEYTYILLNKPKGFTTTKKDRFAEKTVFDLLPKDFQHLHPVGRLDKDTSGLLLLTNDGDLTYRLTHPKFNVSKIYEVKLDRKLDPQNKQALERGVLLEDGKTSPCKIKYLSDKLSIEIHEGRKRQVKRMFAEVGCRVVELKRIREGNLSLDDLKEGSWRILTKESIT